MLVEGPQRDWLAFGHVVVQPTAVDLSEGNASGSIDRIGQPDIAVKDIGCHRNQFPVKIQKTLPTSGRVLNGAVLYLDFFSSKIPSEKRKVTISTPLALYKSTKTL